MNHVFSELDKYDKLVEATGSKPKFSPYEKTLILTLEDGRQVKVPENLQKEAIDSWTKGTQPSQVLEPSKEVSGVMDLTNDDFHQIYQEVPNGTQMSHEQMQYLQQMKQQELAKQQAPQIKPAQVVSTKSKYNWKLIVGVVVVALILFYLYKTKYKNNKVVMSPNSNWVN